MSETEKPLPRVTPDTAPFWESLKRHRAELPFCADCGKPHFPPGPVCPFCFAEALEWRAISGEGVVSSWVVVHKEWFSAFHDDIPYNAVQVELAEGPRITANIVDLADGELRVGLAVTLLYDDVSPDVTMPRFRPRRG